MTNKKETSVEQAVDALCKALKEDAAFYYSYQANIAMAFVDRTHQYKKEQNKRHLSNLDIHTIANDAAKHFLDLLINHKNNG